VNLDKTNKQAKLQCLQNRKKLKNPTKDEKHQNGTKNAQPYKSIGYFLKF
jgi:hypothetical protein